MIAPHFREFNEAVATATLPAGRRAAARLQACARICSPAREFGMLLSMSPPSTIKCNAWHQRERAESLKVLLMLSVVHFDGRWCRAGGRLKIHRGQPRASSTLASGTAQESRTHQV